MKKSTILAASILLITSCVKEPGPFIDGPAGFNISGRKGVFILNEGNFNRGNGSLSFYSYDSLKVFNNIFYAVNNRPLGDIPYSMYILGPKTYIVVNNSGKIEVAGTDNMKSSSTITGLVSPRNISFVSDQKAYVTSLFSDSLAILDISSDKITGYINVRHSSESIVSVSSKTYVANWIGGNKIFVIDNAGDTVIDSVEVGVEPESMVLDRNDMLWVLCNGGWARVTNAELCRINTRTNTVEERYLFPSVDDSPLCLQVDDSGGILYYLHNGVKRMNISDTELPEEPFIQDSGHLFYKIAVNPENGDVFVTDAVDYQQKGYVLRYDENGILISESRSEILPGGMCFKNE